MMGTDIPVDTLLLAGRDQGWGTGARMSRLSHPLPTSPVKGEVLSGGFDAIQPTPNLRTTQWHL